MTEALSLEAQERKHLWDRYHHIASQIRAVVDDQREVLEELIELDEIRARKGAVNL